MHGGFALLHPRVPDPHLCEGSITVLGRTVQEIYFGAPDGRGTKIWFVSIRTTMHKSLLRLRKFFNAEEQRT